MSYSDLLLVTGASLVTTSGAGLLAITGTALAVILDAVTRQGRPRQADLVIITLYRPLLLGEDWCKKMANK